MTRRIVYLTLGLLPFLACDGFTSNLMVDCIAQRHRHCHVDRHDVESRSRETKIKVSRSNDNGTNADQLMQKAKRLRESAEALERELAPNRKPVDTKKSPIEPIEPASYNSLNDSMWQITFRIQNKLLKDDNNNVQAFTGKRIIKLLADGYTQQVTTSPEEQIASAYFKKTWGWDQETSQEDGKTYLLWSADIEPNNENMKRAGFGDERLYFQARIDTSKSGEISINEGKVTVKQAVDGGFWGVFNAGGILAEFKDIGDFTCRPVKLN